MELSDTITAVRQTDVLNLPQLTIPDTITPATQTDTLRMAENAKLNRMEGPLWRTLDDPKSNSGQLSQAVYAILKIMERRAKLNGLDMHTGAHVSFSHIEIVYKDKTSGAVIDAPEWTVYDSDDRTTEPAPGTGGDPKKS